MMMIAATKNAHKLKEINEILNPFQIDVVSAEEAGWSHIEITEDGETFEENSMKKAETIMRLSKKDVIADDSGLSVQALGGQPGVYSARFSGEHATDKDNNIKLLSMLEGISERSAKFVSVISLVFSDGRKISVRGECSGRIAYEE